LRRHAKAPSTASTRRQAQGFGRFVLPAALAALGLLGALIAPAGALAAGDANRASCPAATETSPGFRTYMPDCRAYELVSPPFTGGFSPTVSPVPLRSNQFNGDRTLLTSLATIAETPGSGDNPVLQGAVYAAARGVGGWRTSALTPPVQFTIKEAFPFPREAILPSADMGAVAWLMLNRAEPGSHFSVYIREGTGPFDLVGPATPVVGAVNGAEPTTPNLASVAAANLHRLALKATAGPDPLWPGDTTSPESKTLYEYDRSEPGIGTIAAEPKLVGVENEGHLASNAEAQLIGQCGVILGGGELRENGAVSADGRYLYFTVQHNEECLGQQPRTNAIYTRIDGEHTVAISEPSAQDCAECLQGSEREEAEEEVEAFNRQAVFQGASSDGTKVFFTSFQELLPGIAGGTLPNLYRFDFDAPPGERLQLVSRVAAGSAQVQTLPGNYAGFAASGERAYFIARGPVQLSPGSLNEENALGQKPVANGFNLYLWEAPPAAGQPARIAFVATPAANLNPVATPDGRFVVFTTTAQLTPGDTSAAAQIFEYGAVSGALVRVSVGDQGYNENGNTANPPPSGLVSADGRRVFFLSSRALTPGAPDDPTGVYQSIYEWTWEGAQPSEATARVSLIVGAPASGINQANSFLVGIDPTGDNVFFFSTLPGLVPQQTATTKALYDARVEGGFPAPPVAAACEGDTCQGAPAARPGPSLPASATFTGPGNVKPRHHRARKHKGKKQHKQHKRQRREARTTGRASR
jgi:hypothetical protein